MVASTSPPVPPNEATHGELASVDQGTGVELLASMSPPVPPNEATHGDLASVDQGTGVELLASTSPPVPPNEVTHGELASVDQLAPASVLPPINTSPKFLPSPMELPLNDNPNSTVFPTTFVTTSDDSASGVTTLTVEKKKEPPAFCLDMDTDFWFDDEASITRKEKPPANFLRNTASDEKVIETLHLRDLLQIICYPDYCTVKSAKPDYLTTLVKGNGCKAVKLEELKNNDKGLTLMRIDHSSRDSRLVDLPLRRSTPLVRSYLRDIEKQLIQQLATLIAQQLSPDWTSWFSQKIAAAHDAQVVIPDYCKGLNGPDDYHEVGCQPKKHEREHTLLHRKVFRDKIVFFKPEMETIMLPPDSGYAIHEFDYMLCYWRVLKHVSASQTLNVESLPLQSNTSNNCQTLLSAAHPSCP
jgi:hypothetical protein